MTNMTISAGLLSNRTQGNDGYVFTSADSDIDQDLLFHYVFKSLKGNYSCPFNNTMEKCLDVGYTAGAWMMEMATEFPRCQFYGIDIEPSCPDLVYPNNCLFERGDFLKGLPYLDQTFDVVHLRMTLFTMSVDQILFLLQEITRVTKKGGYIEYLEPELSANNPGPSLNKLISVWTEVKCTNNVADGQFYSRMDKMLVELGFANAVSEKIAIPLGKWGNMVGEFSLAALKHFIVQTETHAQSKLNLQNEDDLENFINSIENECEIFKPYINVFSGFAQKL